VRQCNWEAKLIMRECCSGLPTDNEHVAASSTGTSLLKPQRWRLRLIESRSGQRFGRGNFRRRRVRALRANMHCARAVNKNVPVRPERGLAPNGRVQDQPLSVRDNVSEHWPCAAGRRGPTEWSDNVRRVRRV
jgi:hypothetical protein